MSNREKGERFAHRIGEYLAEQGLKVEREYKIAIGLNSKHKKNHAFDFGNKQLLVECKYYDWTVGDNNPSAKIATLNEAMVYFYSAPETFSKMLFISQTSKKGVRKPETLAEYYVRLYKHFIPDGVEIWEFNEKDGKARMIFS